MAEIMLALEGMGLVHSKQLTENATRELGGFMVDPDISLRVRNERTAKKLNFVDATVFARKFLAAKNVLIDSRINQDKVSKIEQEVQAYIQHVPDKRAAQNYYKPSHLSVSYYATRESKIVFRELTEKYDIFPVCFTTSSRSTKEDYSDRNTTPEELARKSTVVLSELGYGALMCAAVDAEIVKSENPDMFVFATGGLLLPGEQTHHTRTALISETYPHVDMFVLGSSVYDADLPIDELVARQNAALGEFVVN